MMYRYKKGFIPWWYRANISNKDFNLLKKYIAILLIINICFIPITIHRAESFKSKLKDNDVLKKEMNKNNITNKDLETIKWFIKSEDYRKSSYIYDESGEKKISFALHDIYLYKDIINDLRESGISYKHINMEETDDGWKVEISF